MTTSLLFLILERNINVFINQEKRNGQVSDDRNVLVEGWFQKAGSQYSQHSVMGTVIVSWRDSTVLVLTTLLASVMKSEGENNPEIWIFSSLSRKNISWLLDKCSPEDKVVLQDEEHNPRTVTQVLYL